MIEALLEFKNTTFTVCSTFSCPPRHRQLDLLLDADAPLLRTDFGGGSAGGFGRQSQAGVALGRAEEQLLHRQKIREEEKVGSAGGCSAGATICLCPAQVGGGGGVATGKVSGVCSHFLF